MSKNFKVLGLAFVVAFAMSAVVAQAAFAVDHTFTSSSESTFLTGDDDGGSHELVAGSAKVVCATSTFTGSQSGTAADSQTITPTYTECKIGSTSVTVTNEGCSYLFDSDTTADANTGGESATVTINCEAGKFIKIVGPGCTIDFGSQGPLHGVKYTATGGNVTTEAHVFGIKYNATNAGCALLGIKQGESSNGTYIGNSLVKGYSNAGHTTAATLGLTTP